MTAPRTTHAALYDLVSEIRDEVLLLKKAVGEPNEKNDGGTGLHGEVLRVKADLAGFTNLKNKGIGALAAMTLFGTLILLGIQRWIENVMQP